MALVPKVRIVINKAVFYRVNSIKIESSASSLADKAIVKIPSSARLISKSETHTSIEPAKYFAIGDKITIKIGYNTPITEFEGYIKRINYTTPLEIECEDAIFLLRRKPVNKSWSNTDLKSLIAYLLQGTGIKITGQVPQLNFERFYLKNVNAAYALQKLRDEYGLSIYMLPANELYVGLLDEANRGVVKYYLGDSNSHQSNVIKPKLKYSSADEVKLKIKAVHIMRDNSRTEVEVGDDDGELRTLYFYDLQDAKALKDLAVKEIQKYKYTGYRGTLKTFLLPFVKHGMIASMLDAIYPERSGDYLVKKVLTTFDSSGAKRTVELGLKIS